MKVHPVIEDENNADKGLDNEINTDNSVQTNKVRDVLYKIVIKILCYIGMLSCIAI